MITSKTEQYIEFFFTGQCLNALNKRVGVVCINFFDEWRSIICQKKFFFYPIVRSLKKNDIQLYYVHTYIKICM